MQVLAKPLPPENDDTYFEYLLELKNRITKIQALARENLEKAKI